MGKNTQQELDYINFDGNLDKNHPVRPQIKNQLMLALFSIAGIS